MAVTFEGAGAAATMGASTQTLAITTTGTDRILVAYVASMNTGGSGIFAPVTSMTDNTGLEWTLRDRHQLVEAGGSRPMLHEVWWAYAPVAGTYTCTAELAVAPTTASISLFAAIGCIDFANPWEPETIAFHNYFPGNQTAYINLNSGTTAAASGVQLTFLQASHDPYDYSPAFSCVRLVSIGTGSGGSGGRNGVLTRDYTSIRVGETNGVTGPRYDTMIMGLALTDTMNPVPIFTDSFDTYIHGGLDATNFGWSNNPESYITDRHGTGQEAQFRDFAANDFYRLFTPAADRFTRYTTGFNLRMNDTALAALVDVDHTFEWVNKEASGAERYDFFIKITPAGRVNVWTGGNTPVWHDSGIDGVFTVSTNHYIELTVWMHETYGGFELFVDDVSIMRKDNIRSGGGGDILHDGTKYFNYLPPHGVGAPYTGQFAWLDDFYLDRGLVRRGSAGTITPPDDLELGAAFTDEDGFSSHMTLARNIAAALADDGGLNAVPTIHRSVQWFSRFFDDATLFVATPTLTDPHVGVTIAVHFTDDAGFTAAAPHLSAPDKHVVAHFTDDAGFTARPTILPLGGPFFFAWANEGEDFISGLHGVSDEDVFSWTITQDEGDFAKATIVLRNPRVGLLSTGRKRWAFLSIKREGVLVPLFYGRIIGIPANVFDELVSLEFVARPFDFNDRKAALADTLRTLPYWDHIFIDPDSWLDDDTVLEARTANWHIDRVTHEVTISDLITAEDGVMTWTTADYFYDNLQLTLGNAPLRAVQIQATLPWTLETFGDFDLTGRLLQGWGGGDGGYQLISSFTFDGLSGDWPKQGSKIGDGWTVTFGALTNQAFQTVKEAVIPYYYDATTIPSAVPEGSFIYPSVLTDGEYHGGVDGAGFNNNYQMVVVPIGYGRPQLSVTYDASREMGQFVTFTMLTDVQDVLTLAPESDVKVVTINSNPLSDYGYLNEIPIDDSRNRDYVGTARGQLSIQHLMLVARANLVNATRVITTTFETDLLSGLDVSLRKGSVAANPRIPGGQVAGKHSSYTMSLDGETGAATVSITMMSCVGRGGSYVAEGGTPTYADADYVDPDYQEYRDVVQLLGTGDIAYTMPVFTAFDDGVDFKALSVANIVQEFTVVNPAGYQRERLAAISGADQAAVSALLETIPTQATIKLLPMTGGPFLGAVPISVQPLVIPKQIDLEAPST